MAMAGMTPRNNSGVTLPQGGCDSRGSLLGSGELGSGELGSGKFQDSGTWLGIAAFVDEVPELLGLR